MRSCHGRCHPFRPQQKNLSLGESIPVGSSFRVKEPTFIHRKDKENEFRKHQESYKSDRRATRGGVKRRTQRSTHAVSGSNGKVQSVLVFERSSYSQTMSQCWSLVTGPGSHSDAK